MLSRRFFEERQRKLRNQAQDKTRPAHSCAEPLYRVGHFHKKCSHGTGIHSVHRKRWFAVLDMKSMLNIFSFLI